VIIIYKKLKRKYIIYIYIIFMLLFNTIRQIIKKKKDIYIYILYNSYSVLILYDIIFNINIFLYEKKKLKMKIKYITVRRKRKKYNKIIIY